MDGKPNHYDGSVQAVQNSNDAHKENDFILTDEMRKNISGNPFEFTLNN